MLHVRIEAKISKTPPRLSTFWVRCHLFACTISQCWNINYKQAYIFLILLLHRWMDPERFLRASSQRFTQKRWPFTLKMQYVWHTLPTWLWVRKLFGVFFLSFDTWLHRVFLLWSQHGFFSPPFPWCRIIIIYTWGIVFFFFSLRKLE